MAMRPVSVLALCLLLPACASTYRTGGSGLAPYAEGGAAKGDAPAGATKAPQGEPAKAPRTGPVAPPARSYSREGPYAGISMLFGFEQFDTGGGVDADDSDLGIGLRGGWRTSHGYAAEVVIQNASDFEIHRGGFSADVDIWSFGVQGKYYFTPERAQPYFLAGFGVAQADADRGGDDEGLYLRVGVGIEYYLKDDVAFFGEIDFDEMMGGVNDFDHVDLQFGVLLRF